MNSLQKKQGFSLMETVIALGVVALLLTSFLSVFGPAANNIRKAISSEEAERLSSALLAEMNTLRPGETGSSGIYSSAFDKAFDMINGSDAKGGFLVLYNYRADASATADNLGIIPPYTEDNVATADQEVILQSAVRSPAYDLGDLQDEINAAEGSIFVARLTQLVYDQGTPNKPPGLKPAFVANEDGSAATTNDITNVANNPGVIYNPNNDGTPRDVLDNNGDGKLSDDYPDAAIAFQAKFYLLNASTFSYLNTLKGQNLKELRISTGKPIFTRNMAIRR